MVNPKILDSIPISISQNGRTFRFYRDAAIYLDDVDFDTICKTMLRFHNFVLTQLDGFPVLVPLSEVIDD